MKKGSVSSLVPMAAAEARAATMAHSRRMKSNMAIPFFHPPGLTEAAATRRSGALPLATELDSGSTLVVVESPLFILKSTKKRQKQRREFSETLDVELVMEMGVRRGIYIKRNKLEELVVTSPSRELSSCMEILSGQRQGDCMDWFVLLHNQIKVS